jgi:hypothetical protein
MTSSRRRSD